MAKVAVENVKVDPITVQMPMVRAEFVRFEASKDGKHFYVVYELVSERGS